MVHREKSRSAGEVEAGEAGMPGRTENISSSRRTKMNKMNAKEIDHRALSGVAWTGRAALFCLGLSAMLALLVVTALLAPVMLAAAIVPATVAQWTPKGRRDAGNTAESPAPRKAMAS
jgi:hypothetical protein